MRKTYRVLTALSVLALGACSEASGPMQLAGPMDSIAKAPRTRVVRGSDCTMPALDNPALGSLLVAATMGGGQPGLAATAFECSRRRV